jgi:hypothetical protein
MKSSSTLESSSEQTYLKQNLEVANADETISISLKEFYKWLPNAYRYYALWNHKLNNAYETISLDQIDLTNEPEVVYQSKSNKKTKSLIDKYVVVPRTALP